MINDWYKLEKKNISKIYYNDKKYNLQNLLLLIIKNIIKTIIKIEQEKSIYYFKY